MKKAISLILTLVLCLASCACGSETQKPDSGSENQKPDSNETSTNQTEAATEGLILYPEGSSDPVINCARLKELVSTVELTAENWQDYLEVYTWTREIVEKDAFGEIVSQKTETNHALGAKEGKYFYFQEFAIELKDKQTGELETYTGTPHSQPAVAEDFSLERYECTRIKGTLYLIDIPEEVIMEDSNGNRAVNIGYSDISLGPTLIASIYGRMISHLDMLL